MLSGVDWLGWCTSADHRWPVGRSRLRQHVDCCYSSQKTLLAFT